MSWPSSLPHLCARMLLQLGAGSVAGSSTLQYIVRVVYVCRIYAVRVRVDRVCTGSRCARGLALSRQLGRVVKAID